MTTYQVLLHGRTVELDADRFATDVEGDLYFYEGDESSGDTVAHFERGAYGGVVPGDVPVNEVVAVDIDDLEERIDAIEETVSDHTGHGYKIRKLAHLVEGLAEDLSELDQRTDPPFFVEKARELQD